MMIALCIYLHSNLVVAPFTALEDYENINDFVSCRVLFFTQMFVARRRK